MQGERRPPCPSARRLEAVGRGRGGWQRRRSHASPRFKRPRPRPYPFAARVAVFLEVVVLLLLLQYRRFRARFGSPPRLAARPSAGQPLAGQAERGRIGM